MRCEICNELTDNLRKNPDGSYTVLCDKCKNDVYISSVDYYCFDYLYIDDDILKGDE